MKPCTQRGFTLLELLVALAIFALSAGALLKTLGEQGRNAGQLEARYFAQLAARNQLSRLHLQPAWPDLGERDHDIELAGRRFALTQSVRKTDSPSIRRVTLSVSGDAGQILAELEAFMGPRS